MGEWSGDPHLEGLGRRFRDELRAEAEEYEQLAAKDLLRSRRLGDVALELLVRGDRVAVRTGEQTFTGVVCHAATDLAVLRTATDEVDLHLSAPLLVRVLERVRTGGAPRSRGASSFTARLHQHEAAGTPLLLGCPQLGEDLHGRIEAVATDHVVLVEQDATTTYVATSAIAWVRPA